MTNLKINPIILRGKAAKAFHEEEERVNKGLSKEELEAELKRIKDAFKFLEGGMDSLKGK